MEVINTNNINEARNLIIKFSKENKKIAVLAQNDEFNRKILESNKVGVLVFSDFKGHDKLRQRDSGLNQVLCKLARDNNIEIGIDFKELIKLKDKEFEMSSAIARIMQNIRLCRKYQVKIILVNSEVDNKNLIAFMLSLGASTDMAKYAVDNCIKI